MTYLLAGWFEARHRLAPHYEVPAGLSLILRSEAGTAEPRRTGLPLERFDVLARAEQEGVGD
jgi:hypothetical protein